MYSFNEDVYSAVLYLKFLSSLFPLLQTWFALLAVKVGSLLKVKGSLYSYFQRASPLQKDVCVVFLMFILSPTPCLFTLIIYKYCMLLTLSYVKFKDATGYSFPQLSDWTISSVISSSHCTITIYLYFHCVRNYERVFLSEVLSVLQNR